MFYSSLESTELANQIIPHVIQWSNDIADNNPLVIENENDYGKLNDKNWSSIMNGGSFNGMKRGLLLNDYSHVQFIHLQEESFKNVSSLTISNLSELKLLVFENKSFSETTSLSLSSIF